MTNTKKENNGMRKTRDFSKKIGDTKGTIISYKDRCNKGQKQKDLRGAEEILKRWQEHTKELYKKALNDPINHNGVMTHLEQDILDCEVTCFRKHHYEQN